jgi:hypothetical protein
MTIQGIIKETLRHGIPISVYQRLSVKMVSFAATEDDCGKNSKREDNIRRTLFIAVGPCIWWVWWQSTSDSTKKQIRCSIDDQYRPCEAAENLQIFHHYS